MTMKAGEDEADNEGDQEEVWQDQLSHQSSHVMNCE